ncbi:hypothetical protein RRG08_052999 [Elysia crispata]|uniref:Uncharacterized protein n=1 Tax=Elysia crispata TaxID=231223 RepID=A0AAE0ZMA2_9GAST|nr:hypothetical protein RRG08_052999 [Elysia crispata]
MKRQQPRTQTDRSWNGEKKRDYRHSPTLQYFIITETNARDDLRHFPNPKSQYINGGNCGGRLKSHWPQSLGHTQTHWS